MTADILTKLKIKAELKQQFTNNSHNGALFHQTDQSYIPITFYYVISPRITPLGLENPLFH